MVAQMARSREGPWLGSSGTWAPGSVPSEHSAHVEHVERVLTSVVTRLTGSQSLSTTLPFPQRVSSYFAFLRF